MSNIIQKYWGGRLIDFIDSLPESVIPLKYYKGRQLKELYWYDSEANRIIKRNGKYEPYPYRYYHMNTTEVSLQFMIGKSTHIQLQELIDSIEECYPSPEEVEDMIIIKNLS